MTSESEIAISVDRAVLELRRGRPVVLTGKGSSLIVLSPETAAESDLEAFAVRSDTALLISAQRAAALGMAGIDGDCVLLDVERNAGVRRVAELAGLTPPGDTRPADPVATAGGRIESAALALAKQAHLVPSLLVAPAVENGELMNLAYRVSCEAVAAYDDASCATVRRISEAEIPLDGEISSRFVLFRTAAGDVEHIAVVIPGTGTGVDPVVRIHSQCLTGDLFGSLRCDCGSQLHQAMRIIADLGGGCLLYLQQEGRGIGLANKLRAYALQDGGMDTHDADMWLGFEADERHYEVAAQIFKALDIDRVRLLTNNPRKVDALVRGGVRVSERIPLVTPTNPHNRRYLESKVRKAGHFISLD